MMTICPPATTVTRDTTAHKEECMKMNACIVNWMTNQCPINLFVSIGYWEVSLKYSYVMLLCRLKINISLSHHYGPGSGMTDERRTLFVQ